LLSILAAAGISGAAGLLSGNVRAGAAILPLALYLVAPVRWAARWPTGTHVGWREIEEVARQVDRVTPPEARVYTGEAVFFASRRLPPQGMENIVVRSLELPPERAASVRVVTASQIQERLRAGRFATIAAISTDPAVLDSEVARLYAGRLELHGFTILFNRIGRP
jgi:hypothetical protein